MKKLLKILTIPLLLVLLAIISFVSYLTVNEYRPLPIESIPAAPSAQKVDATKPLSLATYNIGYGGLDETTDFFMDGGKNVQPESKQRVEQNMAEITHTMKEAEADVYLLQEVDRRAKRSYEINQEAYFQKQLQMNSLFAYNFKVAYVPIPLPPIGRVESGLTTLTNLSVTHAQRVDLPNPFKWPVRIANLNRALLETRLPIANSDKELVIFNLHLEAYDNGEGKIAQSKKLADVLAEEYAKGNYVIAGGDFNQAFEGSHIFPTNEQDGWAPGTISEKELPAHFSFAFDDTYPTVRVLNAPYTGDYHTSQVHVIDGFIVSDNLTVEEIHVLDKDFKASDHQLVKINLRFL